MSRILQDLKCPKHGNHLVECIEPDGDETGVWIRTYFLALGCGCRYPAERDDVGAFWPIDEDG